MSAFKSAKLSLRNSKNGLITIDANFFQPGTACQARIREYTGFRWESLKERDNLQDQGVDGRTGSEWILGRLAGGVEWIQLAQVRDR
jgi:hypothetical protein